MSSFAYKHCDIAYLSLTYKTANKPREQICRFCTSKMHVDIAIVCFIILGSVTNGHVIRHNNPSDLFISHKNLDLVHPKAGENITYYSYHIHVYFLQKNVYQTKEAASLRDRFINEFKVDACNDDCDTWCPRICHWDLNMDSIGPHPIGSWGIYLPLEQFTQATSWISMYHSNLTVLLHPNSGYPKIDHLLNAFWIRSVLPLDGDQLPDIDPPPPHLALN